MATLPPDTRAFGTPDPAGDMDAVVDCLATITGATPGSGTVTAQGTMNTLAGGVGAGQYLHGDGTNAVMGAIPAADLPAATTSVRGAVVLGGNAADIAALGNQAAGSVGKAADAGHIHPGGYWQPSDDGFLGFNSDPSTAGAAGLLVATNAYLARLPIRAPTLVSKLWVCVTVAGAGASTTSFVWIVSGATGAVLAQSTAAAAQAAMTGTGWQSVAMSTPPAITPGTFPYAVVLPNLATTQPTLLRQLNTVNNAPQASASVASLRWAQQAGFGTAVAAVTLASNANTAFSNIVGWS